MWAGGDYVIVRQLWDGHVWAAIPATVIEDGPQLLSIYIAPGTSFMGPACTREDHLRVLASGRWDLVPLQWRAQHHLWAAVPGEACSVWTIWTAPDWKHLGWKVNPEAPIRRTRRGFDTTDHVLDAVIPPDLISSYWKDEHEFIEAIHRGLFARDEGDRIRLEATRVATEAVTTRSEQLKRWAAWRPPFHWKLPVLVSGWEVV